MDLETLRLVGVSKRGGVTMEILGQVLNTQKFLQEGKFLKGALWSKKYQRVNR